MYNHLPEQPAVMFFIRGVVDVARQMKKKSYELTQK